MVIAPNRGCELVATRSRGIRKRAGKMEREKVGGEKAAGGKKETNIGEALQLLVALREAICRRRVNKRPPRSRDGLMPA